MFGQHSLYRLVSVAFLIAASFSSGAALAENIDPADDGSQWAWAENVGWINAEEFGCLLIINI